MRIVIVNPNTTASMTEKAGAAGRLVAAPGTEIEAVTNTMGPVSIEGYYDEVFAVPGLIRAIGEAAARGADAAVIACFDDTGLDACRAFASIPVIGICEAAMVTAAQLAKRISVVTTVPRAIVPIADNVAKYGFGERTTVRAADFPVLALEDPHSGAVGKLEAEIARAIAEDRAEAVVLGCAGMADLAQRLSVHFGMPVIDGVAAAVKQAEALVGLRLSTSKVGSYAAPLSKPYVGAFAGFAP